MSSDHRAFIMHHTASFKLQGTVRLITFVPAVYSSNKEPEKLSGSDGVFDEGCATIGLHIRRNVYLREHGWIV